ncbi:MAG TPA: ABC transporter permease [Caldilineaceae bacterium]|nr:ABC transporter permease [Caldilineaceae bacterium]
MQGTTTAEPQAGGLNREWVSGFLRKYAIVFIFLAMFIGMWLLSDAFLQPRNLLNIVRQISVMGLIAIGVTMVIITTGIDLSSGSVLALAAVVAASLAQSTDWASAKYPGLALPLIAPILAALLIGAFCGSINGWLIARFRIPAFIATLGMMTVARGFALLYSDRPVSGLTDAYNFIGQGELLKIIPIPRQPPLGIPIPILILAAVAIGAHVMLNNPRFGRHIYAIGGNEQAARISGLNVGRIKIGVYTIAGLLSGLAGLVLSSRIGSGQPGLGVGYELDAIAAAVIGGTSLSGGIGTIWGTIVGALIIGVLNNGLDLRNVSAYWQTIVKGSIIVIAVIVDERKNR